MKWDRVPNMKQKGCTEQRGKQSIPDFSKLIETLQQPRSNFNVSFQSKLEFSCLPSFTIPFSSL